jgi:hypothetical protein
MGFRIPDFDLWRPGYAGASVAVRVVGTDVLAAIFADAALTVPLANPQTLLTLESADIQYGKWAQPVYAGGVVFLDINSTDRTAEITPALSDLDGEVASGALVTPTGAVVASTLADLLSRFFHAEDYGALDGASAATNTTTLTAAIGAAAAAGGGAVIIPAGTFPFNTLTLPEGVLLVGHGRGITVLQSTSAGNVITLSGDRCGFAHISIDGVLSQATSVGILSDERDEIVFDDAEVLRFETGIKVMGGERGAWRDLYIENCGTGVLFKGEGAAVRHFEWRGGLVTNCTVAGVQCEYFDAVVSHNVLADVGFENNPVLGLSLIGARFAEFIGCWFVGPDETADLLNVADDSPANADNTILDVTFTACRFDTGEMKFEDSCETLIFDRCSFLNIDVTLTLPTHSILIRDCVEDAQTTLLGEGTKWLRWRSTEHGTSTGITTDASPTKAWGLTLDPGQVVMAQARVVANQVNGIQTAEYLIACSAKRPGSSLAYDTQVANFTVGQMVTGATSGATGLITADADGGATGTLTLRTITGAFLDNETITDPLGGQALVNGALVAVNVTLLGTNESVRPAREDAAAWDALFAANGPELELRVTGEASKTIQWVVDVDVTPS